MLATELTLFSAGGKFARGGPPSVRARVHVCARVFSLNQIADGKFGNVSVGTAERTGG